MKIIRLIALIAIVVIASSLSSANAAEGSGKLRHVVCFKFKPEATPDQIRKVEQDFVALKSKIPQIAALEWGVNCSPEKHDKGFTHCFALTFNSAADRDAYLPHPAHNAFGKSLSGLIADVFVLDYAIRE